MNIAVTSEEIKIRILQISHHVLSPFNKMLAAIRFSEPRDLKSTVDSVDCKEKPIPKMPGDAPHSIPTPSPPPNFDLEEERLKTFDNNWPVTFLEKEQLARIGFFCMKTTDMVKCHFCGIEIGLWEQGDNPVTEHLKWSSGCRLLNGLQTANVPIDEAAFKRELPQISHDVCGNIDFRPRAYVESGRPMSSPAASPTPSYATATTSAYQHPQYQIPQNRLGTFRDWPHSLKQTPDVLSDAGFYYTGTGDRVICFCCGGGLNHWEQEDDPWQQHAQWYPKCQYLLLMKGQSYIDEVLAKKESPSDSPKEVLPEPAKVEVKVLDELKLCKICYAAEFEIAFVPCGHVVTCAKCASAIPRCPQCREEHRGLLRIYIG